MYVDAKRFGNSIFVSERVSPDKRAIRKFKAPFNFYIPDERSGKWTSMFGDKLTRVSFSSWKSMEATKLQYQMNDITTFESDVKPEYKLLEQEYYGKPPPKLNLAFIDIETEVDPNIGYARFETPYAIINAVTIYTGWNNERLTLAVAPPTMTREQAQALVDDIDMTYVCEDEAELLTLMLAQIDNADVITGWNTSGFDIPYIMQRIRIVLGGESLANIMAETFWTPLECSFPYLKQMCVFDCLPRARTVPMFGRNTTQFITFGRVLLDYLELYKKFTFSEQHSYKLDYILQEEVNETKVAYTGTLDQLWKEDFRLFVEYNIQDVLGLVKLDDKLKFADVANELAHMACVSLTDALGSVTIIEQAVLLELHHSRKRIAPDKNPKYSDNPIPGAFVLEPTGGMYKWIASFDVNSLYPSVIRMLNISSETLIGQFDIPYTERHIAAKIAGGMTSTEAWGTITGVMEYHDIVDGTDTELTLRTDDGDSVTLTAKEWKDVFSDPDNPWCLSANGTVFDMRSMGILPFCLEKWYKERKKFKKKSQACMKEGDKEAGGYWDRIQHVRKIFLNSLYGALLNEHFRFNDPRFGQSTTLSGRVVCKHMNRKANELIAGEYSFNGAVLAADTDSSYVTLMPLISKDMDLDAIVKLADKLGDQINQSFPQAMKDFFFVDEDRSKLVEAGREVVAERGIFKHQTKKRYALAVRDIEGLRVRKLKIMGMETQRSDTPKWIQKFLKQAIELIVGEGKEKPALNELISQFRTEFRKQPHYQLGTASKVSKLAHYTPELDAHFLEGKPKPRVHFAVMASYWYTRYKNLYNDKMADPINDGDKIEILPLIEHHPANPLKASSIAIPTGMRIIPQWIKDLPVDVIACETKLVDTKLNNTFDMLHWHFSREDQYTADAYEFED